MPDYSQNLNRYSYALNNPLVFTDPTGEFPIVFAIGFIVGAYLGGLSSNDWKLNPREWEMNTNTFLAMGFGGLAGGFGGQYLLGAGGVLSGGTPLNVAIGSNIGNTFNAGANFVVSNGSVMLQGLGYTTAAGGGAYYLINQNQGQNYQQMVDQEIYNVQEKYSNAWFQNEPGYKPADLGAIDYLDQMSYSLSYAKRFGYGMEIQEIFDFSNASVNFQNTPSWGASRWSVENPAYSINLFDGGDKVSHTFSGLRFLAEGGSNLNSNYLSYGSANLSIDKFPKYNIYGDRLPYPYGIQIMGFVGDSRKTIGTFRFNNWNDFRNFNMKIFNGPPKGYWFK